MHVVFPAFYLRHLPKSKQLFRKCYSSRILLYSMFKYLPKSKWKLANEKMPFREHPYPIGCFEGTDIEIHFLHYLTAEEALEKWKRRMERFDFDNFLAIGFQQNECSKDTILRFERLNIRNKVFFTNWDLKLPHAIYIPKFKGRDSSPDPYKYANTYYHYLVDYLKENPLK